MTVQPPEQPLPRDRPHVHVPWGVYPDGDYHVELCVVCGDPIFLSPDCAVSKHPACSGDAWDDVTDSLTACACPCHTEAK